ncbi:MAG TPA: long-chain fatty acid--CoA ligase, partial [Longimicrobiales bacterium]|nr:long-chain fatty acid--CoA ligase [Longimicrobiales bacterium]
HGGREIVSRTTEGSTIRTTWGEVRSRAKRLASALAARGIGLGDRIATLAWNTHRHLEVYYGVSGMGAVCHTLNPRLHPSQLTYILNHAADRVLFLEPTFIPLVEAVLDDLESLEACVVLCDGREPPASRLPGLVAYEAFIDGHGDADPWPVLDELTAASLCYTSGTTGNPKGALYTHRSTVLHAYGVVQPDVFDLGRNDVVLPVVPMFHANAWGLPYAAAAVGAKIVFPGPRLDPAGLTEQFEAEGVTMSAGVPSVFIQLVQYWKKEGIQRPGTLEFLVIGGSAPPRSLMESLEGDFGIRVRHAWGMTEMSPLGTANVLSREQAALPPQERSQYHMKQGQPPFGVEVRVVDEHGARLPHDGVTFGELQVRGPWVVDGYFKVDEQKLTPDGWFPTGDVATLDESCCVQITDRTKDLIKSGGEWISSIDVENAAMGHPQITMAAVIGVPHEKWGERPLLIAVPASSPPPEPEEVREYLRGSLADWQLPDRIVWVDELPLGATGKVQKSKLRERYAREHATGGAEAAARA